MFHQTIRVTSLLPWTRTAFTPRRARSRSISASTTGRQSATAASCARERSGAARSGVDRDHGPRALDAGHVLAGARDAEREVELGRHGAAALADLALPRDPAEVDGHAAPADRRRPGGRPAPRAGGTPPRPRPDRPRRCAPRPGGRRCGDRAEACVGPAAPAGAAPSTTAGYFLDRRRASRCRRRAHAEGAGPERDDRRRAGRDPDRRVETVPVRGAGDLEPAVGGPAHAHGLGRQGGVQADRELRRDLEARGAYAGGARPARRTPGPRRA